CCSHQSRVSSSTCYSLNLLLGQRYPEQRCFTYRI
ncbi:unnamed protein product, partial [Musa acuminata var. zebrina]